jgi:hypothetical protein
MVGNIHLIDIDYHPRYGDSALQTDGMAQSRVYGRGLYHPTVRLKRLNRQLPIINCLPDVMVGEQHLVSPNEGLLTIGYDRTPFMRL